LEPLAKALGDVVQFGTEVVGVARRGRDLVVDAGRASEPRRARSMPGASIQRPSGSRIDRHFESLIANLNLKSTVSGTKVFLWKASHVAEDYIEFRVAANDLYKRSAEDIPVEEMANAMEEIVRNQVGLDQEDLIREAAKVFGFARLGTNVNAAVIPGVHNLLQRGKVVKHGERLIWKG
ncbi:MAG: hypothetical protein EOO88_58760, partial [Pedobacter sp.]